MTAPLIVPSPAWESQPNIGGYAALDGAVSVSFGAVRFPDGSAMRAEDYVGAQALLSRRLSASSAAEVWNGTTGAWLPAGGLDLTLVTGVPLVPPPTGSDTWNGVLVGKSVVAPAAPEFPQYRLRGAFRAHREGVDALGLGPESDPIRFAFAVDHQRFAVLTTPETLPDRARIALRNGANQFLGELDLNAESANPRVTLRNYTSAGVAVVTLESDGSITLAPAAGKPVRVSGDLETEHITYRPSGGGPRVVLL